MTSIDRLGGQDAARSYVQNADSARTAAASSNGHTGRTHHAAFAPKTDTVTLSDSARSLAAARDAVHNAPDVRQQRVSEIKQQIDTGTYQVSARVLARKMVEASQA
jgi:negative regulator of flagellin synthesis FlgM